MKNFDTIDHGTLQVVTGGRNLGPAIQVAKDLGSRAWKAAEKGVTGLGILDGATRVKDWAADKLGGGSGGGEGANGPTGIDPTSTFNGAP